MDIQIVGEESLKIKVKKANLAIDPKEKITKFDADAILSTDKKPDISRINGYRVVIDGPGEYEVSGLKISGIRVDDSTVYELVSEGANVLVARVSDIAKLSSEKLDDYQVVVLNVDTELNQSIVTAMEPRVVILYGSQKNEGAKKLGSEITSIAGKISVSEYKLPEELEVMLLG